MPVFKNTKELNERIREMMEVDMDKKINVLEVVCYIGYILMILTLISLMLASFFICK